MKMRSVLAAIVPLLSAIPASHAQETFPLELRVQAFSASDPDLTLPSALNCAGVIKELDHYDQYQLVTVASVQGPPGVLFILHGPRNDVVLLKCGTSHDEGGCGEDTGGGCEASF